MVVEYIRNNWRSKKTFRNAFKMRVTTATVLWEIYRDLVHYEIYKLQNLPCDEERAPPNVFKFRSTAIKNVLASLSKEAHDKVEQERRRIAETGFAPAICAR